MKSFFQIITLVIILTIIPNSCRYDNNLIESATQDIVHNKKSYKTSKSDTIDELLPADPPVKDGQQWKSKNNYHSPDL